MVFKVFLDFYGIYIFYRGRRIERKGEMREKNSFCDFCVWFFYYISKYTESSAGIFYQAGG
jgi:hypothetical protein